MSRNLPGVAPDDLLRAEFKRLDDQDVLRTTWPNEQLILLQSVEGRAHKGYGAFNNQRYPDTTPDDVAAALRLDPVAVRADRKALIDDIREYVERTISGEPPDRLLNAEGEPLLGIGTLRYLRVHAADVLRGLYLGGLRDDADVRHEVEQETGVKIGSGRRYLVDQNVMRAQGLDGAALARGEWADSIARFREQGLIVGPERKDERDVACQFIRYSLGPGASDDAAIVAAGLCWGLGVAVGVFFADAVDTLEKDAPNYAEQDGTLAEAIGQRFAGLKLGRAEARKLTFWATITEAGGYRVPDSSLRHLLVIDRKVDLCAVESHLLTVEGVPCPPLGLSQERSPSPRFYEHVRRRMEAAPL